MGSKAQGLAVGYQGTTEGLRSDGRKHQGVTECRPDHRRGAETTG